MCFVKLYPQASDSQADSQQKIRILAARKSSEDSEIARPGRPLRPPGALGPGKLCAASIKLRPSGSGRVVSGLGPRSPLRHDWQSPTRPPGPGAPALCPGPQACRASSDTPGADTVNGRLEPASESRSDGECWKHTTAVHRGAAHCGCRRRHGRQVAACPALRAGLSR